ncbi:MAG: N-6 DNA methylase, partial [Chloroflexi bacterium]|nr:N-6 DNA methylase [Chloroflexota bacterium]
FTPVHIVAVDQGLDERSGRGRTPHALVQDYLNRSDSLWGMVTNGAKLRLLRDSARLSKPTYLEFDIQAMIEGNVYSEFVALYRLLHASRLPHSGMGPHECLIESYYNQGIEEGGRVREKLRDGVRNALEVLGSALARHPDSEALREALSARLDDTAYYRQLLNFVYRMLFLMVTEERRLLFTSGDIRQQTVYDRYYSITHLRERAERYFAGDTHSDLWAGLAQTFRLFRDDNAARQLGLSPLNGELFGRGACRDIESASCTNEAFLAAMLSLSTFDDNGVRRRVNYAHLDVEEFGSVYESLLDYRPVVDLGGASGAPPRFQLAAGTERKQTGSYYTPPELVRELVESALVPVMEERLAEANTGEDKEQALLDLRVCDPASGSGHFLLAAARRIARELARIRSSGDEPAPSEYRAAVRDVVRSCIYAVDKNPLAVDLCKVALWIESHAVGLPLGFLDHHVKCGDSLVGVMDLSVLEDGIPNDAYKPVTGDDKSAAAGYRKRNQQERRGMRPLEQGRPEVSIREIAEEHAIFAGMEENNPKDVQAKFDRFWQLRGEGTQWWDLKIACDLWTSAFFLPLMSETPEAPQVPTTDTVRKWLESRAIVGTLTGKAAAAAAQGNFFHWPLEFPEVFDNGGFDVVLGNPPWERIKLQEKEFFETRDREIADAPNKAARDWLIRSLPQQNPALAQEFARAVHDAESVSRFVRNGNRFPLTGRGDVNTYSIFAETGRTICGPTGRMGIIVPSGIATDDTTKYFFSDLVDARLLVSLYDFENRERVFPGIDSRIKFCLLTLTGANRPSPQAEFAFFLYSTEQLQDEARRFTLEPEDFAVFNPNTRTCPVFRTKKDADIAGKMYRRAGVFWKEARGDEPENNPWGINFQRMFDMSNDSGLFRTHEQLISQGWKLEGNIFSKGGNFYFPLYEAKLFHQYDHRFGTFDDVDEGALAGGNARNMTAGEKADPSNVVIPRYWVPKEEVNKRIADRINDYNSTPPPTARPFYILAELARNSLSGRSSGRRTSGPVSSQW